MSATVAGLAPTGVRAAPRARTAWRMLLRKRAAWFGGGVLVAILLVALLAPWIVPYDPYRVDAVVRLQPPGLAHLLGTDDLGRDVFSRVVYGTRLFVLICTIVTSIAASIGVTLGLLAGSGPGWLDMLIMRCIDILLAFPYILLVLAVIAILGPSLWTAMVAVGIAGIAGYARLVRGEVLSVRTLDYVEAMRALGASEWRIRLGTILPNIVSPLVVYASFAAPLAVLAAAALSFLGLGAQPPAAEWGAMLVNSRTLLFTAWWTVAAPGCAIFIAILSLNLLGNALRDVLDPRSR